MVLGKSPPGQFPPDVLPIKFTLPPPGKLPPVNYHLAKFSPGKLPLSEFPPGQIPEPNPQP